MPKAIRILKRTVLFFILWLILTGADAQALWMGAAASVLAAWAVARGPALRIRYPQAALFGLWFFGQSFKSGLDVARRALSPALPLNPAVIEYDCAPLSSDGIRLFAALVSLMPGTLSVGIRQTRLSVHALDGCADVSGDLDALKTRLMRVTQ